MSTNSVWNLLRDRVLALERTNNTWLHNQAYLLSIFREAETLNVSPVPLATASLSNMCDIVTHCKAAIREIDTTPLAELSELAGTLSTQELRIVLRGENRQRIGVLSDVNSFTMQLSKAQYALTVRRTRTT